MLRSLDVAALVAIAGLVLTNIYGFAKMLRAIGRLEVQLELIWAWYLAEHPALMIGGRRATDARVMAHAHDRGAPLEDDEHDEDDTGS